MSVEIIFETIDEELELFSELRDILNTQQQQLIQRDAEALAETTGNITDILEQTRQCRQERSSLLAQLGHQNTPEGMDWFIQQSGNENDARDWLELISLVEQCKEINQSNGETLRLQQELTEKQLQRMTRQQSRGTGYSADGKNIQSSTPTLRASA